MSKALLGTAREMVKGWFLIQLIVIIVVTLFSLLHSVEFAGSVFIGGMICFVPSVIFAKSWLSFFNARYPGQMLVMFYFGEVVKFSLMIVLFILVFKYLVVNALPVLLGFASAQVGLFLGPILKNK